MDLVTIKSKLSEDEFTALDGHVKGLKDIADHAKKESIEGRKSLKSKLLELESFSTQVLERAGVDSVDEFLALPPKAQTAEVNKQLEARAKRLETDLKAKDLALNDLMTRYTGEKINGKLTQAIASKGFLDSDVPLALLSGKAKMEGDEVFVEGAGGARMSIDDAVAMIATQKPYLVKASGQSGSGASPAGFTGSQKSMKRAQFDALNEAAKRESIKSGVAITD